MPPISSLSLSSALRRAFPCLPRLVLRDGDLVVRGGDDVATDSAVSGGDGKSLGNIVHPPFAPLTPSMCYRPTGATRDTLFSFNERHGYTSSLFLECLSPQPSPPPLQQQQEEHRHHSQDSSGGHGAALSSSSCSLKGLIDRSGSVATNGRTPTVAVPLLRCEERLNLTDCLRTRLLQEELRRTEAEFRLLHQRAHPSLEDAVVGSAPVSRASPLKREVAAPIPDELQLVWKGHGWCMEDSAMAEEESKRMPQTLGSTGYWRAWLKPFKAPLNGPFLFCMQSIQHFQVEVHVTFINAESRESCLATGHHVAFPWRCANESADYWASTGEPVHVVERTGGVAVADDNNDNDERNNRCNLFSPNDCCWFTLAELPRRRLQIRRGGNVFRLPVYCVSCGFFLHEAPPWFLLSCEEVLRARPLSPSTVKATQFASDSGAAVNIMAAAANSGPPCEEFVFVLNSAGAWRAYPRRHGRVNFHSSVTHTSAARCSEALLPLLFIDINAAVQLMRGWSRCHQVDGSAQNTGETEEQQRRRRLIDFFAHLRSTPSSTTFIPDIISHCAFPVKCPLQMQSDGAMAVAAACGKHTSEMSDTENSNKKEWPPTTKRDLQLFPRTQSDVDYAADFPAVDRRVYTAGHRISKAYTDPRDEQPRQPHKTRSSALSNAIARDLVKVKEEGTRRKLKLQSLQNFLLSRGKPCNDSSATMRDLGIVSLSFTYTVPAVNAAQTEAAA